MKKLIIGVVTSIFLVMGCAAAFAKDTAVDKFINLCNKGTVEDFNRIIGKVGVNTVLDDNGNTPILIASNTDMFGIVKRLCDMGANVNAKNKYGYNAMVYAALNRNPKMIQYLIDKGLNVKKCYAGPNNDPILRLMFTGEFYYPYYNQKKTFDLPHFDQADYETFELLIKHGANVTDINSDKDTLMHLAVLSTNWLIHNANLYFFKMIFKLDPAGSKKSLTMRNKNGLTPLDIAKRDYVSDAIRTYLNEQAGLTKLDPYN